MTPYKNFIFDTGRTLWNSDEGIIDTYIKVFSKLNKRYHYIKRLTDKELESLPGPSLDFNLKKLIPEYPNIRAEAHDLYRKLYDAPKVQESIELFSGIRAALGDLRRDGIFSYVFTEEATEVAKKSLKRLGIYQYFSAIQGTKLAGETASREEIIERLVARENKKGNLIDPSNTVFVCNRMRSAEAAMNLGYRVFIAEWGISPLRWRRDMRALREAILKKFGQVLSLQEPKSLPVAMNFLEGKNDTPLIPPSKNSSNSQVSQLRLG